MPVLSSSSFKLRPLSAALLAALGAPSVLAQQEQGQAPAKVLPQVEVRSGAEPDYKPEVLSSPKLTQPLADTPQTITVIPGEVIEDQNATTLREVLRNVPGISIQAGEGGAPAGDQLSIRGFSARTDIFVDGVRDFGGYARDPFNLEQVEVVKGPASNYTGRGSTGGSINLVSKTPRLDPFTLGTVGVGTDAYARATLDTNSALSDTSAFRLNLMGHSADVPGRDVAENKRWGVAPSIAFGIGTPTRTTLSYFHLQQDNVPDYGIPWVPASNVPLAAYADQPAPVDFSNFYGLRARDYEDVETDLLSAEVLHTLRGGTVLRNLLRYGRTYRDSIITAPRFASTSSTDITRTDWKSRDQEDAIIANQTDLTFTFDAGGVQHALVTGVEIARETEKNHLRDATGPDSPDTDLYNPNPNDPYTEAIARTGQANESDADSIGVYVTDTVELNERWQLLGSMRWDSFDLTYTPAGAAPLSRTDRELSWRLGAVYKPQANASVYAAYGSSFNPAAEGLTLSTSATSAANVNVGPEETRTLELGTKWEVLDRRLLLSAAVFRTEKTNARTQDPADPNDVVVLEGEQRVEGIELGATGSLTDAWKVYAGYTYLDSEVLASRNPAEVGNELANTPHNTLSLWTTYAWTQDWEAGVGASFVDDRFNNTSNARVAPSYWVYSAMAAYRIDKDTEVQLNVYNLTDEKYIDAVGGGHFIPGAARSAVLGVSFKL